MQKGPLSRDMDKGGGEYADGPLKGRTEEKEGEECLKQDGAPHQHRKKGLFHFPPFPFPPGRSVGRKGGRKEWTRGWRRVFS